MRMLLSAYWLRRPSMKSAVVEVVRTTPVGRVKLPGIRVTAVSGCVLDSSLTVLTRNRSSASELWTSVVQLRGEHFGYCHCGLSTGARADHPRSWVFRPRRSSGRSQAVMPYMLRWAAEPSPGFLRFRPRQPKAGFQERRPESRPREAVAICWPARRWRSGARRQREARLSWLSMLR